MSKFVFLGPPGAGKGTHAKILSDKHKLLHLATGDILRVHIREKTPLGNQAKDIIERGELVPDHLINAMMAEEIKSAGLEKGFILDGYPRTIGQAEALDCFLKEENAALSAVLNFATTNEVVVERLSGRRVCPECRKNYHLRNIPPQKEGICDQCQVSLVQRKDDTPETIRHRLETYHRETAPLIGYYRQKGILYDIPGDREVTELQARIRELFGELKLAI